MRGKLDGQVGCESCSRPRFAVQLHPTWVFNLLQVGSQVWPKLGYSATPYYYIPFTTRFSFLQFALSLWLPNFDLLTYTVTDPECWWQRNTQFAPWSRQITLISTSIRCQWRWNHAENCSLRFDPCTAIGVPLQLTTSTIIQRTFYYRHHPVS